MPSKLSTASGVRDALAKERTLMLTHTAEGALYGLDTGQRVASNIARQLQADLFVTPSEDGLFPGYSQTWKVLG